ncbi:hypothetical protein AB0D46_02060 [Streptomyces sp. NPDC048383]|uniref:hypothetical protein n=1 Tax=Streptomyces sp. NPDC048383 TaxID=3155386 RepID=UPI00342B9BFB
MPHPDSDSAGAVEAVLTTWLYGRLADAKSLNPVFCDEVARLLAVFVLRGGKRLRAFILLVGMARRGPIRRIPGCPVRP